MDSLLAHLSHRFVTQEENLATEGLAYLLAKHAPASEAMFSLVQAFGVRLDASLRFRTQAHSSQDGSIPDLVAGDSTGATPLVCELKFWAALTSNQPVTYMGHLPPGQDGCLLFIVPEERQGYLWSELLRRLGVAGFGFVEHECRAGRFAVIDHRRLAITSWRRVLGAIRAGLERERDAVGLSDLCQLEGLAERMDAEAFLPLTSEEISGRMGQRLISLGTVLNEAVAELERTVEDINTKGLRAAATFSWFGRWVRLPPVVGLLRVSFGNWGKLAATPFWLTIDEDKGGSVGRALAELRHTSPPRLFEHSGRCHVPIYVPTAAEQEAVRGAIVASVREAHDLLRTIAAPQAEPPEEAPLELDDSLE